MSAHIRIDAEDRRLPSLARALASPVRLKILQLLAHGPRGVADIAEQLSKPLSSTSVNIRALEKAGLITAAGTSASGKYNKLCRLAAREIWITLPDEADPSAPKEMRVEVPVGTYVNCQAKATCGILGPDKVIGVLDVPEAFWEPERYSAGLVYLTDGFVEYRVPNKLSARHKLLSVSISLEIASEYPFHRDVWPSDVTLWINGVEMGTWTVPGNPGGLPGKLTPAWWSVQHSQYGYLKTWRVDAEGTWMDGELLSNTNLKQAAIQPSQPMTFRLGLKPDAPHSGGMTLFGRTFGNYPQDIIVTFLYEEKS